MPSESPRPSGNTNAKEVGPPWRRRLGVRNVGRIAAAERLPNTAMEPSARELTLAHAAAHRAR